MEATVQELLAAAQAEGKAKLDASRSSAYGGTVTHGRDPTLDE